MLIDKLKVNSFTQVLEKNKFHITLRFVSYEKVQSKKLTGQNI